VSSGEILSNQDLSRLTGIQGRLGLEAPLKQFLLREKTRVAFKAQTAL
jgi:hypothetical protein